MNIRFCPRASPPAIGYLFTYRYHSFSRDSIEINLFERGGKVYEDAC